MKQQPKKGQYKNVQKKKLSKLELKANRLRFGTLGLKAIESGTLNYKQLEAARRAISRKMNRKGKVWLRVFTSIPVTAKPKGVRMGKGKGAISHWIAKVRKGTVVFEACGPSLASIRDGFRLGGAKLPIKTKIFK